MPVGISFENTALKTSFSLSSLPATEMTPERAIKHRQFNSLTKNRVKATALRRSWGSTASDHREEFWSVLQANYNYIMDNQLIDKCQELDGDLTVVPSGTWSLKVFYEEFSTLYSWLNSVQETIYGKEENITDKALRAHCIQMVLEKSSSLKLFNDQASQLVQLNPEVQEEVGWRATHLNSKWDSILSILGPSDCDHCDQDSCLDIDHELKCLRKWFKIMESHLQPLDFRAKYTKTEIEKKALELNVLHRDIENHGKIVGSVVKLCKKSDATCNTVNIRRTANGLERRWHLLFLRSLEWQCYLESLSKRQNLRNSTSSSGESDSDGYNEPANKYRRLSGKEQQRQQAFESSSAIEDDPESLALAPEMTDVPDGKSGFMKSPADTSHFTNSARKASNLATYYFRHEDTDSDMDKLDQQSTKTDGQSTLGETSEEEWEYSKPEPPNQVQEETLATPKPIPHDTIRRLVQKVEDLVHPDKARCKISRVHRWLRVERPDDSCDASGEDDEKESLASEDLDASTMTLRNDSGDEWKRQFIHPKQATSTPMHNFSISESALNKMTLSTKNLDKFQTVSSNSFSLAGNNSTSSTVEELNPMTADKSSPTRRKKSKLKKRSMLSFGKSDSHIATWKHQLIKSGSFSGYSTKNTHCERNISSDPPASCGFVPFVSETSTTSGADSEEDARIKLPPKTRYFSENLTGKSALEEHSGYSEEAWDNYQEKYMSEPYSESHDSDAARNLLDFGEDYRKFIDSQSDWSALSDMSPTMKRKQLWPLRPQPDEESMDEYNSDREFLRQHIADSKLKLSNVETIFKQATAEQIEDLLSTCDRQITILAKLHESSDEFKMSEDDKAATTELLSQWRALSLRCAKMDELKKLQQQIIDLKTFITSIDMPEVDSLLPFHVPIADIHSEKESCKILLDTIKVHGTKLASLNALVHRFTLDSLESTPNGDLKADISELYEMFDRVRTYIQEKLKQIENVQPAWTTLESRLEQLQKDLKDDKRRIHLLDSVLTDGSFTDQTASCVRDIAKLLSETTVHKGYPFGEFFTTEGSFSDSGISDEGSEHDIGERHGRLAAIRRLVRQLEVALAPDSKARLLMREKLEAAEDELKALQLHCRSLIVRTAACSGLTTDHQLSDKTQQMGGVTTAPDGDDPSSSPASAEPSWFRRSFRTTIAIQLVILTFVCLSYLFEPQCCDHMNNYSWTFTPKLRYEGRPPI